MPSEFSRMNGPLPSKTNADGEQRFITIGMDFTLGILVVVFCYRQADSIRIISARKATKKERLVYEKGI